MPGGRLTRQDRRQIAAGLAADLSYTEIAKRLDRPTSTVTREVMRNGGPNAYEAERAHHATDRRAKRRRASSAPAACPSVPETARAVQERLTDLLVDSGIPRMMACVLSCLYTADSGSLTTAELVERLRVSPASISKAVRYLEGQELIRRERDAAPGGSRRDRYVIDGDVWYRATLASARLNAVLADAAEEAAAVLGPGTPAAARLQGMAQFVRRVGDDMVQSAEHWHGEYGAHLGARRSPAATR